jgi:RNA polymerase sigma factor (sigma-70 family)
MTIFLKLILPFSQNCCRHPLSWFRVGAIVGIELGGRGLDGTAAADPLSSGRAILDSAIEAYYDDIRGAVRRKGLDQSLATEVVHDLYIRLSSKPEWSSNKFSLRAFLMRAAVNLGIDRMRRLAFENRLFAALDAETESIPLRTVPVEDRLDVAKRVIALQQAISELPNQCRNVFIAHRIGSQSKDDIAESLGIKRRMVDRHLRKALMHCMERMDAFN